MDLAVIRLDRVSTENRGHRQHFTMGRNPIALVGVQVLIQALTVMMLSTPGSDVLAPEDGFDIVSVSRASNSIDDHRTDAVMAYSQLRQRMIAIQSDQDVPDDERLTDLEVVQIYLSGDRFVHILKVTTAAGESVTFDTTDIFLE